MNKRRNYNPFNEGYSGIVISNEGYKGKITMLDGATGSKEGVAPTTLPKIQSAIVKPTENKSNSSSNQA
jgi:hypothetical protein